MPTKNKSVLFADQTARVSTESAKDLYRESLQSHHTTNETTSCSTEQLSLLSPPAPTPDSPIRFEPAPWASCKGLSIAICGYCDRSFGGIYKPVEVDFLARYFGDWKGRIEPSDFIHAAELAIRFGKGGAKNA